MKPNPYHRALIALFGLFLVAAIPIIVNLAPKYLLPAASPIDQYKPLGGPDRTIRGLLIISSIVVAPSILAFFGLLRKAEWARKIILISAVYVLFLSIAPLSFLITAHPLGAMIKGNVFVIAFATAAFVITAGWSLAVLFCAIAYPHDPSPPEPASELNAK